MPALVIWIRGFTMLSGFTLLSFIPTSVKIPTLVFDARALIQSLIGIKLKNTTRRISSAKMPMTAAIIDELPERKIAFMIISPF
jgi:hypothetical protein